MRSLATLPGVALLAVLVLATAGDAGARPDVLLAWHALLFATALVSWWFAATGGTAPRPAACVGPPLAAWALVASIGFARAPYGFAAGLTLLETAAFLAMCLGVVRCAPWLISRLGPVLVLAGWVQAGILAFQYFLRHDPRPAGTFLNPNHLAAWLGATVLFCAGRWAASFGRPAAFWPALASLPLLGALVLSGSRGAWIGMLAGGALLILPHRSRPRRTGRWILVAAFAVFVVGSGVSLGLRMQQPDPFRYQRLQIWRASTTPLLASPWFGTGPGQFAREAPNLQFPDGRGALRYDRGFRTTHSDWIRVGAEFGWPGVVALGWIVVSVIAHAVRRRRSDAPVDRGALAALVALFVHAGFDNLARAPALYLLGACFLGLVIATDGPARRAVRPLWRAAVAFVALYLFLVADVAPWKEWSQRIAGESADPERHGSWNPADAESAMRRAEAALTRAPLDWRGYAEARRLAERSVALSPRDGELLRRRARLEAAALPGLFPDLGNRDRVAALYRESMALQRTNPFVPIELAAFLLDTGDPAGARRAAERALEIEPQAAAPRLLLARAWVETGDAERAAAVLDRAEALAAEHAAAAEAGAYARDLLTLDAALVRQVREAIAARQDQAQDARFDSGFLEDGAGERRPVD